MVNRQQTVRRVEVDVDPDEVLFDARDEGGHQVTMDLAGKLGKPAGRGFAARDLLLVALAGCSGASFVAELRRRGKRPDSVFITVSGRIDTTPPAVFRHIDMHFTVRGTDLDEDAMTAAVHACHGDCSVHATLSHVAEISVTYDLIDATKGTVTV
jgi:putative redox protein